MAQNMYNLTGNGRTKMASYFWREIFYTVPGNYREYSREFREHQAKEGVWHNSTYIRTPIHYSLIGAFGASKFGALSWGSLITEVCISGSNGITKTEDKR